VKILFVGDVYAKPGRRAAAFFIPQIMEERGVDFCIVNGENSAGGFGITEKIGKKFHAYGADVITTGNHVWDQKESLSYIQAGDRVLRPANYPDEVGGVGAGVFESREGIAVGVVSLQGRTNMLDLDCPFRLGEKLVEKMRETTPIIVVDFHAEATSEKIAMGWFMDGKVSAVLGTHTHVQTADEHVLPQGTAYITDAGMTGPHDSVIGAEKEAAVRRFINRMPVRFEPASGDVKLCGVLMDIDETTGKAQHIERLRLNLEE
jgi:2',3'-cyclic-nucleotide 2'-phosphodiesterase